MRRKTFFYFSIFLFFPIKIFIGKYKEKNIGKYKEFGLKIGFQIKGKIVFGHLDINLEFFGFQIKGKKLQINGKIFLPLIWAKNVLPKSLIWL